MAAAGAHGAIGSAASATEFGSALASTGVRVPSEEAPNAAHAAEGVVGAEARKEGGAGGDEDGVPPLQHGQKDEEVGGAPRAREEKEQPQQPRQQLRRQEGDARAEDSVAAERVEGLGVAGGAGSAVLAAPARELRGSGVQGAPSWQRVAATLAPLLGSYATPWLLWAMVSRLEPKAPWCRAAFGA